MEKHEVEQLLRDMLPSVFGAAEVSDEGLAHCVATDGGLASVVATDDMVRINGASVGGVPLDDAFFREVAGFGKRYSYGTPVYWEGQAGNYNLMIQYHVPYSVLSWDHRPTIQFVINIIQLMASTGAEFGKHIQSSLGGTLLDPMAPGDRGFFSLNAFQ